MYLGIQLNKMKGVFIWKKLNTIYLNLNGFLLLL